jgi:general stress protein YciG
VEVLPVEKERLLMAGYKKKKRGFAAMTPERRQELARKGNKALRAKGLVNRFTPETGAEAARGRVGGAARA